MVVLSDGEKIKQLQELVSKQQLQIKSLERKLRIKKQGWTYDPTSVGADPRSPSSKSAFDAYEPSERDPENSIGARLHEAEWKTTNAELLTRIESLQKDLESERLRCDNKTRELRGAADQLEVLSNALKLRVSSLGGEALLPSLLVQIGELQKALSSLRQDLVMKEKSYEESKQLCNSLERERDNALRQSADGDLQVRQLEEEKSQVEKQLKVLTRERKVIIDYLKAKATEREELENELNRLAHLSVPHLKFVQGGSVKETVEQAEHNPQHQGTNDTPRLKPDEKKDTTTLLDNVSALSTALAAERMKREFAEAQIIDIRTDPDSCSRNCEEEKECLNAELGVLRQRLLVSSKARDLLQEQAVQLEQENAELRRRREG